MAQSIYDDMSQGEKSVAFFLRDKGIEWIYESPVFVVDKYDKPRMYSPDFYLPDLGVYIEVCGNNKIDYSYRKEVYEINGIPVIFVQTYKKDKWENYVVGEIKRIHRDRGEFINKL